MIKINADLTTKIRPRYDPDRTLIYYWVLHVLIWTEEVMLSLMSNPSVSVLTPMRLEEYLGLARTLPLDSNSR